VIVQSGAISLTQGGVISSATTGSGNAGTVMVTAGSIVGDGAAWQFVTGIDSSSSFGATGNAGSVAVSAGSLTLQRGATITTVTSGIANGGDVTVDIAGDVLLQGRNEFNNFSSISALASGTGIAGAISISARRISLLDGAKITTEAGEGGGGNITLRAGELVHLADSSITTSVHGGAGNGGNIVIDPPAVVLDHSSIIAQAFGGNGGNISIDASVLILSPDSLISASSQLGISGAITIAAPSTDVTAGLAELSGKIGDPPQIARAGCASPTRIEKVSRLVEGGRGGLPPDADAPLSRSYFGGEVAPAALERSGQQQFVESRISGRVAVACR
jgi:large exoprotein involved in heme utilization and adhesion